MTDTRTRRRRGVKGPYPVLGIVDEEYLAKRRAYVVILDQLEAAAVITALDDTGHIVINGDEDRLADEVDLRVHLLGLTAADDLILPGTWWTSVTAHQLVQVAGWLGVKFIDYAGEPIETVSAAGYSR